MATTSQSHTGDGSTTNYTLQFSYVKQSDVKATLDGTATTAFTFANATTLSFNTAPANGVAIKITRETDLTNINATFFPGSSIKAEDLNGNFEQTLFVSQESNNLATTASSDVSTALNDSSIALSTANIASTNATNALNAVNNVVAYTVVANVSSLPSSPSDGDRVEVTDSTNAESTSSITGLPSNFTGASGLNLRLQYSSSSAKFVFVDYIVQDPDSRYGLSNQDLNTTDIVTFARVNAPLTGNVTGNVTGAATGDFSIADKIVHTGDTNTAIRFPADDTITAETSGSERLRLTQNSNNSTTLSIGNGSNLNSNTSPDRTSVKIGGTLHLESSFQGSNHKTGMYYNCYASGQSNYYQGTFAASSFDYRAAAATLNHGAFKVFTDPSTSTNYSAGDQITTMVETLTCANGYVTKPNAPAFSVWLNGGQSIAHNTDTKVNFNTEVFDIGGNFDNSTNYRFTAPVAGKYLFLGHLYIYNTMQVECKIYKNAAIYKRFSGPVGTGSNDNPNGLDFLDIIHLDVGDFIELFGYHYHTGSSGATIYGGGNKESSMVGYFLG